MGSGQPQPISKGARSTSFCGSGAFRFGGCSVRRKEYIRGVQLDALTLRQVDELARQRGMSRSQLIRELIRQAAADNPQQTLPGFGDDEKAVAWSR